MCAVNNVKIEYEIFENYVKLFVLNRKFISDYRPLCCYSA